MTSMYLNANYPDLFAASIFVGGQWDADVLLELKDDKFFDIVAEGDLKASEGMTVGNEHMYSFDYAYKLESVRDWLFEQSK